MDLLKVFEKQKQSVILSAGVVLMVAIGLLDYATGYELAFSIFYLLPIALVTWLTSRRPGLVMAAFSALIWLAADVYGGNVEMHPVIYLWNTLMRLGFFLIIVKLLSALRDSLDFQTKLARQDPLTGTATSRYFYELLQKEIERHQRYRRPFTVIYVDADNFKSVNDKFGHSIGDEALRTIAHSMQEHLRQTDVLARLGGDEFALLLPETDQQSARAVTLKIQTVVVDEMRRRQLPVTLSMGALTCQSLPLFTDQIIASVDHLMYQVKLSGKNSIRYAIFAGEIPQVEM